MEVGKEFSLGGVILPLPAFPNSDRAWTVHAFTDGIILRRWARLRSRVSDTLIDVCNCASWLPVELVMHTEQGRTARPLPLLCGSWLHFFHGFGLNGSDMEQKIPLLTVTVNGELASRTRLGVESTQTASAAASPQRMYDPVATMTHDPAESPLAVKCGHCNEFSIPLFGDLSIAHLVPFAPLEDSFSHISCSGPIWFHSRASEYRHHITTECLVLHCMLVPGFDSKF